MPSYEWGMQKTPYSPRPEIVADTMRRNINRNLMVQTNDISTIDQKRMKEIDDLFKVNRLYIIRLRFKRIISRLINFFLLKLR